MALRPCKECGREISTDAKTCPHCGKGRPTSRTTRLGILLVGILIFSVYTAFNMERLPESTGRTASEIASPSVSSREERTDSPRNQALDQIKLDFTWRKGGFETAMIVDFVITNPSPWRVKDLEVTCDHFGPSGTKIDSNVKTIYEIVEPKGTKRVSQFNMGFIRSQATQSSCTVTNLVVDR